MKAEMKSGHPKQSSHSPKSQWRHNSNRFQRRFCPVSHRLIDLSTLPKCDRRHFMDFIKCLMACLINFGISEAEASAGRIPIKSPRYLLQIHWCHVPCVPETREIYSQWHPIRSIPIMEPMKTAPPKSTMLHCCTNSVLVFAHKNNTSKLNETRDASMKIDERPAPSK